MINLLTKFEVRVFTRYGDILKASQNVENGVVRSLKIAPFDRAHMSSY